MSSTANQNIRPITTEINENGHIEIGGCDTVELAEKYGTPLFVYDEKTVRTICKEYKEAFADYENAQLLFASKAFLSKAICRILDEEGFGFDVASGGELYTAYKANTDMSKIMFNGNNKAIDELELGLDIGIGRFSADNFLELSLLNEIAQSKNKKAQILLRVAPGIECHTHEYIKTGQTDSKFGFDMTQIDEAIELIKEEYENIEVKGLHVHLGSQIFEIEVYKDAINILLNEFKRVKEKFDITLSEINLGGGLGIKYTEEDAPPSINEIGKLITNTINETTAKLGLDKPKLYIEPGRSIVGTAGVTLYTVGSSKIVPNGRKYVSIDGGMGDNIRPALYQAKYNAVVANKMNSTETEKITISGKYCESSDILTEHADLPVTEPGDIVCVFDTGAYGYSMSSNYLRLRKPEVVLVNNGTSDVIIKRDTYDFVTANDEIPERMLSKA